MRVTLLSLSFALFGLCAADAAFAQSNYLGNWTRNPYLPAAPPQLPGTFSNPYGGDAGSPKLYDNEGNFHGNLNSNPYDPNGVSNPYGRYGSPYSPDSVNNPYGQFGSQYSPQSPNNPYGTGMPVYGR